MNMKNIGFREQKKKFLMARTRIGDWSRLCVSKLKKLAKKLKTSIRKNGKIFMPIALAAGGVAAFAQAALYASNPDRNTHRVSFSKVDGGTVHVYPTKN